VGEAWIPGIGLIESERALEVGGHGHRALLSRGAVAKDRQMCLGDLATETVSDQARELSEERRAGRSP
jgi:hypothetical protein